MTDTVPVEEVGALVEEAVAAKVDQAVREAVERATLEVSERLQANFDIATEHLLMEVNDPTKADGAVYQTDTGTGYVFGLIEVELIDYNPRTKRTEAELAPDSPDLQPLIADVEARGGIVRPLLVYRNKQEPGRYMLIKGHRRLAALKALAEELVQAYIMPAKPPMAMEEEWVNGF